MLALYRSGRQADALASYREAWRRLGEELGILPSVELRKLEAAIFAHDPALDPSSLNVVKAIVYDRFGSPDVLRLGEIPQPRVERDDDVLVKVHATSINSWDWDLLRGYLAVRRKPRHR